MKLDFELNNFKMNFGTKYQNKLIDCFNSEKFFQKNGIFYNSYTFFNFKNNTSGSISTSDELKVALKESNLFARCPVVRTIKTSPTGCLFVKRISVNDDISDYLFNLRTKVGHRNSILKIYSCSNYTFCIGYCHEDSEYDFKNVFIKNSEFINKYEMNALTLLKEWIAKELPEVFLKEPRFITNPLGGLYLKF